MTLREAVLYIGIFDVAIVLAFGFGLAFLFAFAGDERRYGVLDRLWPAFFSVLGSTVVACIMLGSLAAFLE